MVSVKEVMRVSAFCLAPKSNDLLRRADVWALYTGDGWRLATYMAQKWRELGFSDSGPLVFVTGPDSGMTVADARADADDFARLLSKIGIPASRIVTDASQASLNTHGQANTLIAKAKELGWRRAAIFTSWYHAPRAFLTTTKRIPLDMDFLVFPEPSYELSFNRENGEIVNGASAWELLNDNLLTRLEDYQEKGFCSTFSEADEYLCRHGF